jgi:acetyltransferase-like isoleucine patch superfamily enzyme
MSDNIFFDRSKLKYCGENVIIGKTVRIRKPEECIIGDGTIIDDFAYISSAVEIGKNCHIASHVSISGGNGKLVIGDYSTISNHCSLHCASSDYSSISLDLPSVAADIQFGGIVNDIYIGNFVTIGAHSCILPGVNIPDEFACGAFSLITIQEYVKSGLYAGIPARFLKLRNRDALLNSNIYYKNIYE